MPYIDFVFDRDVPGYAPEDRWALARVYFEDAFGDLAKHLGVEPLVTFYSEDPDSLDDWFDEDYFDDPQELQRLKEKHGPEEFFDPAIALRSVAALRAHLKDSPFPIEDKREGHDQRLLEEFAEIERALTQAKQSGARFHFVVDPG